MTRPRFILGACLCLTIAGCGGSASAKKAPAHPTVTSTVAPSTVVVQTITPTTAPTPTPTATAAPTKVARATIEPIVTGNQEPVVVSASARPGTVAPGGSITLTVSTRGPVSRAVVYLGTVGPQAPAPVSYELTRSTPGKWVGAGTVPSFAGTYSYSVGLFDVGGHRSVVSSGGWIVQVGSQTTNVVQPLPADVPLAPPFSYGNPVAATFVADGKSVSGSEVASNQRTDVSPDAVAQFYESRLPRNGWVVGQLPAAGSTAWSIGASKGTRLLLVQFTHSTVQVFYGNSA